MEYEYYGAMKRHELLPGGGRMAVTEANRQRYVELYTEWLLTRSVQKQFEAFAHGFHQVLAGPSGTCGAIRYLRGQERYGHHA